MKKTNLCGFADFNNKFQMNIVHCFYFTEVDNGNIVEKLCRNGTVISKNDSQGEILSPGYELGRKYPTNINCSWFIEAPVGKVISLIFNVSDDFASPN